VTADEAWADDSWTAVTALVDSSRRALYAYARRAGHPISREEASAATGMSRGLAAFHLDKLVDAGLLQATYQPPADQPRGRGRSPKMYEPAGEGITVTIPERRYELIAEILAGAIEDDPHHADHAASRHAHHVGQSLGSALFADGTDLTTAMAHLGYEPHPDDGRILLHNCPFHGLAARHTSLVCGLNQAFLSGLLDGLGATEHQALLAPHPGRCCVELTPKPRTRHGGS
jgi:predicted ArsR family transcriptional regulator